MGAIRGLQRHPEFGCNLAFYRSKFLAFGTNGVDDGGRNFLLLVEKNWGPNAEIDIGIEKANDDINFLFIYDGAMAVSTFIQALGFDHYLELAYRQKSSWTSFLNRYETPVDIRSTTTLDGDVVAATPTKVVKLPSQIIDVQFSVTQKKAIRIGAFYPAEYTSPDFQVDLIANTGRAQINLDDVILDEVQQNFNTPIKILGGDERAAASFKFKYPGNYDFDIKIPVSYFNTSTAAIDFTRWLSCNVDDTVLAKMFIQFNEESPIELTRADKSNTFTAVQIPLTPFEQTDEWSEFTYTGTRLCGAGDIVRIWFENVSIRTGYGNNTFTIIVYQPYILGTDDNTPPMQPALAAGYQTGNILYAATDDKFYIPFVSGVDNPLECFIKITGHTTYPDSQVNAFLMHDVFHGISKRLGVEFRSPFLGNLRTVIDYGAVGCGSNIVNAKGTHLRGYTLTQKPFAQSFKDEWEGAHPILCLGLLPDKEGELDVIKIVPRGELFPNIPPVVNLYNVRFVRRSYDIDSFYNVFENGYKDYEINDVSGIDIPHSTRTWASILKTLGKKISQFSLMVAGDLTFERTRREIIVKSKDYQYDNNTFVLCVVEDGANYKAETNERFSGTTNLLNGAGRYNKAITPARNFKRWATYLNGCLYAYLTSVWKFVEGKGNFDMTSTMDDDSGCSNQTLGDISEKQDMPVTEERYCVPMFYEWEHYLTSEEYALIEANPNTPIGISQNSNPGPTYHIFDLQFNDLDHTVKIIGCPKDVVELEEPIGGVDQSEFTFDYTFEHGPFE